MRISGAFLGFSMVAALGASTLSNTCDAAQGSDAQVQSESDMFAPIAAESPDAGQSEAKQPMDELLFKPLKAEAPRGEGIGNTISQTAVEHLSLSGYLQHQIAYATNGKSDEYEFSRLRPGIRKSRTTASIDIDGSFTAGMLFRFSASSFYDWSYLGSADDVRKDEKDELENETEIRDTYLNLELVDNLWFKVGRQTIAWGEAEYTQILDLANPRDEREFGFVDLEDARIPVLATRASYVGKRWGADLVLNQEFRSSKLPPRGSDFDPLIRIPASINVDVVEPEVSFDHPEFLGRVFMSFPMGDVSLIYANVYDDSPVIEQRSDVSTDVLLVYPRLHALGVSANFVTGPWLFKTELGYKHGLRFPLDSTMAEPISNVERPLFQSMFGVEYAGISDVSLSVEARNNHIGDYESRLAVSRDESFVVVSMGYTFLREKADMGFVWAHWFEQLSDSVRMTFSYDIAENFELSAGYITYHARGADAYLYPYHDSDRMVFGMRYSF